MVKSKILIVDDIEINRNVLNDMVLTLGHIPELAEDGLKALAKIESENYDLVLLDILMPEMDGYQVLAYMKNNNNLLHTPVIMISALDETENVVRCIENGADDYLVKPFNPILLKARINACLEKKHLRDRDTKYHDQIKDFNVELQRQVRKQVDDITVAQQSTIFAMAKLAESRDPETGEHIQRMCEYCRALCNKLKLLTKYKFKINYNFIENLYAASPLHDIGKVGISDSILLKPGKLTNEEFDIMKTHTTIGAETLKEVDQHHGGNNFVSIGIEIAESHHEKWDGAGYPHGLAGENIPLAGRVLALGDVYDALTSRRCYKEAFSHAKSRDIIINGRGTHFDPDVVDAFVSAEKEFMSIRERCIDT